MVYSVNGQFSLNNLVLKRKRRKVGIYGSCIVQWNMYMWQLYSLSSRC